MREQKNIKYLIKSNNYIGLLFFALVLASLLYIIKHETPTHANLDPTIKQINIIETPKELTTPTDEIIKLQEYLTTGNNNIYKIYQSFYIHNETVNIDNINEETQLYLAYKYIENQTDFTNYYKYITCEEARLLNIENKIIQCGGYEYNASNYTVNTYITKELLSSTVRKLFNQNIINYSNFYTSENNLCHYINNDYLCVSHSIKNENSTSEKEFIKAHKYNNKIEIIEKYRYIKDGIYYKGFNSNEVGEGYYKSTFKKINGAYYWESTEYIEETS